jgi:hypothetical protein
MINFKVIVPKTVPLHVIGVLGEIEGRTPTHSSSQHYIEVTGQCHTVAALYLWGKNPSTH